MINKKYSFKDFTDEKFTDVDPSEFNNTTIKGSNFYQEYFYDSDVFPSNITGVTFENCNLDNVGIPNGATLINCSNKRIRVQTDGKDWIVDNKGNPQEPVVPYNKPDRTPMTASDLPAKNIIRKKMDELTYAKQFGRGQPFSNTFFKGLPTKKQTKSKRVELNIPESEYQDMQGKPKFNTLLSKSTDRGVADGKRKLEVDKEEYILEGEGYLFKDKQGNYH